MQDTNLKISPYFDDFDRSKNYQKILFKPGYSVQTRELNSMQSTLQNQIERFGQHIFKEGSVVIPGNISYNLSFKAVLIQGLINGISVENYRTNLKGKVLTGASSGVQAEVLDTISAIESEKEIITLYVKYKTSGNTENGIQLDVFKNNEVLSDETGTPVAVTSVQNATSYTGSSATIASGVYFIRGFFMEVNPQKIILDQYTNRPSYKIGLQINESLVTSDDDSTLFDNALGQSNFSSPGADRLKIEPKLVKQNLTFSTGSDFIELLRIENGKATLTALSEDSVYNELEKNLARRTFDESGDYVVRPYTFKVREALDDGENNGVYSDGDKIFDGRTIIQTNTADSPENSILGDDYYAVEVSAGKSYVKGFEVTNQRPQIKIVPKPRATNIINNNGTVLNIGTYFKIGSPKGSVKYPNKVDLYDVNNVTPIGRAITVGLTSGKLYVTEVNLYQTIVISQAANFATGSFVTGNTSGATGFVKSLNSNVALVLEQVTGTFITGESISNSTFTTVSPTIFSISKTKLENVRKIKNTGSGGNFEVDTLLDSVKISGSSFNVSGGNTLTGISTLFSDEVSADSKLRIGTNDVEITSSIDNTVVLASTIANGVYYDIKKLVTKLYTPPSGFTSRLSNKPVKFAEDYILNTLVSSASYTTNSSGQFTLQGAPEEIIDTNSIIITTAVGVTIPTTLTTITGNVVQITVPEVSTSVYVYYSTRDGSVKPRIKEKESFVFLNVDKIKDGTANDSGIYGTRIQDKEISLKFSDVIKIHSIRESTKVESGNTAAPLLDSLILNSSLNLKVGDVLEGLNIKATIVSIDTGLSKVFVLYKDSKFQIGNNLAIPIKCTTNISVTDLFIKQSLHGRYIDITDDFIFSRNDDSDFYKPSKLIRKSGAAVPRNRLIVIFDYFKHSSLSNGFYSVESYGNLTYKDIPKTSNAISMANIVDFRFYTPNSAISAGQSGSIANPYTESTTGLSVFNVYGHSYTSQPVPSPGTVFSCDLTSYLGRNDSIYITKNGDLKIVEGANSIDPKPTLDTSVGMLLGSIQLPPYLKSVLDAKIIVQDNRQYTMRDIGKLDKRLSNVEDYTTLTLLESNTNNLNVLDEDGKNRFKNGFVVDNFKTVSVADTANYDYSASIDTNIGCVRPYPYVNNVGFNFSVSASTSQKTGSYVTIPYTEVSYAKQPYASRVENVTPFESFSYIGEIELEPKKDIWYDTKREIVEGQNINLTDSISTLFDLVVPGGTVWDSWNTGGGGSVRGGGGTSITDTRGGTQYEVGNLDVDLESGDTINEVTDLRYTRSKIINLTAKALKPKTEHGLFIGDTNAKRFVYPKVITNLVSQNSNRFAVGEKVRMYKAKPITVTGTRYCNQIDLLYEDRYLEATVQDPRTFLSSSEIKTTDFLSNQTNSSLNGYTANTSMLVIDNIENWDGDSQVLNISNDFIISGQTSKAKTRLSSELLLGGQQKNRLMSNAEGTLEAFVILPPEKFETGNLQFKLSDDPTNIQVKNLTGSYATGVYYSQGTQLDVTSTITTLETPELSITSVQDERTRFIPDPPPPPPAPAGGGGGDPLAQSFMIEETGGVFITSLELYFLTKDVSEPVTVELRTVVNGRPTANVVPGSIKTIAAFQVLLSNDASAATKFIFDNPLYLSDDNQYAFVVKSSSQKYNLWVSRVGEQDISSGVTIDRQPHVGVVFKSANQSTWISDQYEDIKFNLNRAKFNTGVTYSAILQNKKIPAQILGTNALYMTKGSTTIKVTQPNHGMLQPTNKVTITGVQSDTTSALLVQQLTTSSTQIELNDITTNSINLSTTEGWSNINNSAVSGSNPGYIKIDDEIIAYTSFVGTNILSGLTRGAFGTTPSIHIVDTIVQCFQLNGIPLNEINTVLSISNVISLDEYEVNVISSANSAKRSGGNDIRASRNIPYESITPNISSLVPQDTTSQVTIKSITGSSLNNSILQPSFITKETESIENGVENILSDPRLVLSPINNSTYKSGAISTLDTVINLSTTNDFLSPVLDLQGSSITTISNRLSKEVDSNGDLDTTSELLPSGGKHSAYITKKVVLENESTSIKVLFDGVKTGGNDIKVFAKVKGVGQPGSFDDMNYIEIPSLSYPASETINQYRAFDYELKNMEEFQEFSIKVVMIGPDQSNVPKIKNFRAMALAI
jgi:hypothetical protein